MGFSTIPSRQKKEDEEELTPSQRASDSNRSRPTTKAVGFSLIPSDAQESFDREQAQRIEQDQVKEESRVREREQLETQRLEDEANKPKPQPKKSVWDNIKNVFQNLRSLGQADTYKDSSGKERVEKREFDRLQRERGTVEVPEAEIIKQRAENPLSYYIDRPYYSSDEKYLKKEKDVSGMDVITSKLDIHKKFTEGLDETSYKRFTNPHKNVSDDVYAYVSINATNIRANTETERKEVKVLYDRETDKKEKKLLKERYDGLGEIQENLKAIEKGLVQEEGFFRGLWEGAEVPIIGSIVDAREAWDMMTATRKLEAGEELNTRDKLALDKLKALDIEAMTVDRGFGFEVGSGISGSMVMMAELAIALAIPTPIDEVTIGSSKVLTWAAKNILKSGLVTATTKLPEVVGSSIEYMAPEFTFNWESDDFDQVAEGDPAGEAIAKGIANVWVTTLTELALDDVLYAGPNAVKALFMENAGSASGKATTGAVREFLKTKGGLNGFFTEFVEEIAQKIWTEGMIEKKEFVGFDEIDPKESFNEEEIRSSAKAFNPDLTEEQLDEIVAQGKEKVLSQRGQFSFTPDELLVIATTTFMLQSLSMIPDSIAGKDKRASAVKQLEDRIEETVVRAGLREDGEEVEPEDSGPAQEAGYDPKEFLEADLGKIEEEDGQVTEEGDITFEGLSEEEQQGVEEVYRDLSAVNDLGARTKIVSTDPDTGDTTYNVEGAVFPEFIPEELRSRKILSETLDYLINKETAPEGTKVWQLQQLLLAEGKAKAVTITEDKEAVTIKKVPFSELSETAKSNLSEDILAKLEDTQLTVEQIKDELAKNKDLELETQSVDAESITGVPTDKVAKLKVDKIKEDIEEGVSVEPIVVDGKKFVSGINRFTAFAELGQKVPVVDIGGAVAELDGKDLVTEKGKQVVVELGTKGKLIKQVREKAIQFDPETVTEEHLKDLLDPKKALEVEAESSSSKEDFVEQMLQAIKKGKSETSELLFAYIGGIDEEYDPDGATDEEILRKLYEDIEATKEEDLADLPFRLAESGTQQLDLTQMDKKEARIVAGWVKEMSMNTFGEEKIEVVEKLMTKEAQEAWGRYSDAWIQIAQGTPRSEVDRTFYHEAVHKVLDLFFTTEEKAQILKRVRNIYGDDYLIEKYNSLSRAEKNRLASFQSNVARTYEENVKAVENTDFGIEGIQNDFDGLPPSYLAELAEELGIDPDSMWDHVVVENRKIGTTTRQYLHYVDGLDNAVHAVSLIKDFESGMIGEEVRLKSTSTMRADKSTWDIIPLTKDLITNPNVLIGEKFEPSSLPYSNEKDIRARQREYRKGFGLTFKDVARDAKFRSAGQRLVNLDAMAEEALADGIMSHKLKSRTFTGKVRDLFEHVLYRMNIVINDQQALDGFYRDIRSGKFKDKKYKPEYITGDKPTTIMEWREGFEKEQKLKEKPEFFREKILEGEDVDNQKAFVEKTTSIKLPELLSLVDNILEDTDKTVVKNLRRALGQFVHKGDLKSSHIRLTRDLFKPKTEELLNAVTGKMEEVQTETEAEKVERVKLIENVMAHEIGHLADFYTSTDNLSLKRGNILGRLASLKAFMEKDFRGYENTEIRNELKKLTQVWKPFDVKEDKKYTSYRYSSVELYADAISVLLNDPKLLKEVAPNFYQGFIEFVGRKSVVKANLLRIMDDINSNRHVEERLVKINKGFEKAQGKRMNITERNVARKMVEKWQDTIRAFKVGFVNEHEALLGKMRVLLKDRKIELSQLEEAEQVLANLKYVGNKSKRYMDDIQEGFIDPVIDAGIDMDTVGQILILERNLGDRLDLANPQGLIYDYAQETYDKVKEQLGTQKWLILKDRLTWLRDKNFSLVEEAYKNGLYSEDFFKNIATVNKNTYTPFAVVKYIEDNYITAGIIQAKGTVSQVENPIVTMLLKSTSVIRATEVNRAKAYVVDTILELFPGDSIKAKAIRGESGQFVKWEKNSEAKELKLETISLLVDGKLTGYWVDPYIYNIFEGKNGVGWDVGRKVILPFRFFAKIFKPLVTTLNPSFAFYSNIMRDTERSATNLSTLLAILDENSHIGKKLVGYRLQYYKTWITSLKRSWKFADEELDDLTKEMIDGFAMDYSKRYDPLIEEEDQLVFDPVKGKIYGRKNSRDLSDWVQSALRHVPVVNKVLAPIYDFYMKLGGTFEVNSKIAGYQLLKDYGVDKAESARITRKYVGTPDYKQGGRFTEFSNVAIPFSNIAIQAINADKDIATNATTRSGWWMQKFITVAIPKLLMLLGLSVMKYEDDEGEEHSTYDLLSEYVKTHYLVFPLGVRNGKVVAIKMPQDETSRLLGAIIWKMGTYAQGKGMKVEQIATLSAGFFPFLTGDNPLWGLVGDWMDFAQGRNPYDDFRGRPAISTSKWDEGGIIRWGEMFKWTTNSIGLSWFDTYDDSDKDGFEKAFDLPVLERMFEITDYGLKEKEFVEKDKAKAGKLKSRRKIMGEYMQDPTDKKMQESMDKYVKDQVGEEPKEGWKGTEKAKVTTLRKDFKRFVLENSGLSQYKKVSKAGLDVGEKLEQISIWEKRMGDKEYAEYLEQLTRHEIISGEVFTGLAEDRLSTSEVYNVVKTSIPIMGASQADTLIRELRKRDLLTNEDLFKLRKSGLLTLKGYQIYIGVSKFKTESAKTKREFKSGATSTKDSYFD